MGGGVKNLFSPYSIRGLSGITPSVFYVCELLFLKNVCLGGGKGYLIRGFQKNFVTKWIGTVYNFQIFGNLVKSGARRALP